MRIKNKKELEKGQVMILTAIFFVAFSSIVIFGFVTPMIKQTKITSDLWDTKKSFYLGESGAENVTFLVKKGFDISLNNMLPLINAKSGDSVFSTTTVNPLDGSKTVITTSHINGYTRKTQVTLVPGTGASFSYGIQTGTGGLTMDGGQINGNVYSAGDIIITRSGPKITGSAVVSGNGKIQGYNVNNKLSIGTGDIGDAYAHTVNSANVAGNLKCQSGTGNNKSCNTSFPDPASAPFPISDSSISNWEAEALAGGTIGTFDAGTYKTWFLGPKKINGNLLLSGSSVVNVTGTLWVTGNIIFDGNSKLNLSSSYGASSGVVVADGKVVIPNSCSANGSGISGSYLILVSNSTLDGTGGTYAIKTTGSAGSMVLNAQKGAIYFNGSASANQVTANKIVIDGGTINYQNGLVSPSFVSGPSGSFNITSWKELEN